MASLGFSILELIDLSKLNWTNLRNDNTNNLMGKCIFLQIKNDNERDFYEMYFKDFDDMPPDNSNYDE
jgi:hypothetical protein